ncbi:hypothetical protein KQX54_014399 [Cotesia glomerata]|uniref:Uncharacterized protein n=1 Tax=Cotesia glomerata TaxID=32391 RepID=A0AAV7IDL3_COTGL|nr:hypothetical protein KQX54_014399 [Cotesia glomerata]
MQREEEEPEPYGGWLGGVQDLNLDPECSNICTLLQKIMFLSEKLLDLGMKYYDKGTGSTVEEQMWNFLMRKDMATGNFHCRNFYLPCCEHKTIDIYRSTTPKS